MMKTKIIIGLLSVATVGSTSYAIVENKNHNNEINRANNTIAQREDQIEMQNSEYEELLNRIITLEEKIENDYEYSENTSEVSLNDIMKINNEISSIKNTITSIKSEMTKVDFTGRWKYVYESDENSKEYIYEFKNNGDFYVNDEKVGTYANGIIMISDYPSDIYAHPSFYRYLNGEHQLILLTRAATFIDITLNKI